MAQPAAAQHKKIWFRGVHDLCVCGARSLLQGVSSSAKQLQWPRTGGLPRHVHVLHEQPTQEVCVMGPRLFDKQPCRRLFSLRRRACSHTPSCPPTQQNLRPKPCSTTPANNKQTATVPLCNSLDSSRRTDRVWVSSDNSRQHMQQQHTHVSAQRTHILFHKQLARLYSAHSCTAALAHHTQTHTHLLASNCWCRQLCKPTPRADPGTLTHPARRAAAQGQPTDTTPSRLS